MFNKKSFLTGLALGLTGKPFPLVPSQKEPVPYLHIPYTQTLIINQDDGSLSFDWDWDTMQMDVEVVK
jgi:hypothetical protein